MKITINPWDLLAWISLGFIAVWVFLKMMGVINTPLWLEYAPVYGAVYVAGWAVKRLKRATKDIEEIKKDLKTVNRDMDKIRDFACPALSSKK